MPPRTLGRLPPMEDRMPGNVANRLAVDSQKPESQALDLCSSELDPRLRQLFDYWLSKKTSDRLPGRQHILPEEIHTLLPHLVLYDVLPELGRYDFRVRLIGTQFADMLGRDITGRLLSDAADILHYAQLHKRLTDIVETRLPAYGISHVHNPARSFISFLHLTLPLANDGVTVDMLIGARVCITPEAALSTITAPARSAR